MDINKASLEALIKEILEERLMARVSGKDDISLNKKIISGGITSVKLPNIKVDESNRLDTKRASDKVYTKDVFSLEESGRLGCGIMEMTDSTFDWTLNYDEIDYVMEGQLSVVMNEETVTAGPGEIILIPKGSSIKFSVTGYSRFMYVTYPANWAEQG
jgi:ethanolamine utilization protein EutQ